MPGSKHEAPLALFRERPALVAELLRDRLGVDVPPFDVARIIDADFTQVIPTEFRADLVVELDAGGGAALALIVEVQRHVDGNKRYSWPLYAAAQHARARCPCVLVVIALDRAVAAWAAAPIVTLQPGSPFTPMVIGPDQIPRITDRAEAGRSPELTVLSALTHGDADHGVVRAVAHALPALPDEAAALYFDLLDGSLGDLARRALENEMRAHDYEYQSDFARKYYGQGREKGREEGREEGNLAALRSALRVLLTARLGAVPAEVLERLEAASADRLLGWIAAVGAAPDGAVLAALA